MNIKNSRTQHTPAVAKNLVPGRVYRLIEDSTYRGDLHIATLSKDLICLETGEEWSGGEGFAGSEFEDVTDYVYLDVSNLPPLE